jgi:hypothetical protein
VVSIAVDEPFAFAAVEDAVQKLLAGGLVAEGGDGARRASSA